MLRSWLFFLARTLKYEPKCQIEGGVVDMWGQISGVAGQFKRTINAVASEIKDAVEEVQTVP